MTFRNDLYWDKPLSSLPYNAICSECNETYGRHTGLVCRQGAIVAPTNYTVGAAVDMADTVDAPFLTVRCVLPYGETGTKLSNPKDIVGARKAPLSVVPMNVVVEMGCGMLEGTCKYGRHNYRAVGVRSSVYFDAAMRHLISYWEGEDLDPDSGMSHITKALCSLAVLRDAQMQGKCTDDRPPRSAPFYPELNALAGKIIDRHSDKAPHHYTIEDTV